jgi:hypothetical protein
MLLGEDVGREGIALVEVLLQQAGAGAEQAGLHQLGLADVGGPGGFEHQRGAVAKTDEAGGQVLDIEGLARGRRQRSGDRVVGIAQHPLGLGVAHQPQRQVEPVHAEVDQRAAASELALAKPATKARHAAAAVPDAAPEVEVAEHAGVDLGLQALRLRAEAVREVDHESLAGGLGRGHHLAPLGGRHRHRLFAQHMAAGGQRGQRQLLVELVGRADADRIDRFGRQQAGEVGVAALDAELLADLAQAQRIGVGDRDHLDRGVLAPALDVHAADAQANHGHPQPATALLPACATAERRRHAAGSGLGLVVAHFRSSALCRMPTLANCMSRALIGSSAGAFGH